MRAGQGRHGEEHPVVVAGPEVIPLDSHGDRQHDIGVPGGCRPERVVHHHRLGSAERGVQPGQVLVVMEGVAAAPVHQPDVGIGELLAVVRVGGTGVEQHVGDSGDGDKRGDSIAALRQPGR